jgi:hypothetical protein
LDPYVSWPANQDIAMMKAQIVRWLRGSDSEFCRTITGFQMNAWQINNHWIGLFKGKLQENPIFNGKIDGFL